MEKNTVVLDLVEYNRLTEFERKIREGKVLVVRDNQRFDRTRYEYERFYTESEIIEDLTIRLNDLPEKLIAAEREYQRELTRVHSLTWWQFRKLRRK